MNALLTTVFAVSPIVVGTIGVAWLLGTRVERQLHWMVDVLASGSIVVFAFLAAPWAFTSYYLRYALLAVFGFAVLRSYRRLQPAGAEPAVNPRRFARLGISLPVLLLFAALDFWLIDSLLREADSLPLSFPLSSGTFCVVQGGNSVITNPFHAMSGNSLALDIVELNRFGNRAAGIAPGILEAYQIFGNQVFSPCDGRVSMLRSDLPDNPPDRPDREHSRGNHVVLDCGDAEVVLAHLRQGSIAVAEGEISRTGQLLGRVGNSGNTLEPHLHISARRNGRDIGLRFEGRLLSINSLVVR